MHNRSQFLQVGLKCYHLVGGCVCEPCQLVNRQIPTCKGVPHYWYSTVQTSRKISTWKWLRHSLLCKLLLWHEPFQGKKTKKTYLQLFNAVSLEWIASAYRGPFLAGGLWCNWRTPLPQSVGCNFAIASLGNVPLFLMKGELQMGEHALKKMKGY